MKSTTVYLAVDQLAALKKLSSTLETPQSVLIRHGVDMAIEWGEARAKALMSGKHNPRLPGARP